MKFLLALATVCYSQVITPGGKCPIPPNMQDFSAEDYSGQWYQVRLSKLSETDLSRLLAILSTTSPKEPTV